MRVSLLGELSITGDLDPGTGPVRNRSARAVALVAFLVLHAGSPQPRHRIAGLFWPESGDAQALTNLRRELHHLRQVLGDDPSLVVTAQDLCWQDSATCRVDVRVFDRERAAAVTAAADDDTERVLVHASRALTEYRGELLPGVYEDWVLQARAEIERQCTALCDLLVQARERRGDLPGCSSAAGRAWARPAWWTRSRRWPGSRARWSRARSASGPRAGWPWPRWRSGCGTRRSRLRR